MKVINIIDKFIWQEIPLNKETAIEVSEEDLECVKIKTKCFDVENNCVIDYDNSEELEKQKLQKLRQLRTPLLQAFDIYKSNVNYGIEEDINRENILKWYKGILDLDETSINNPPQEIRRYM